MSDGETRDTDAQEDLGRSLYWAQSKGANDLGAAGIREEILDMVGRLRADERVLIPLGEPNLDASTPMKRRVKFVTFRLLRFVTRRYDRLIAEDADLTAALAGRLASAEQQLEALRQRLDRLEGVTAAEEDAGEPEDGS
jgi:hypothetical protein